MEKTAFLDLVTIIFIFCVKQGCFACLNGYNDVEEVILGGNVTLSCISRWRCDREILWDKRVMGSVVTNLGTPRKASDFRSYLDIIGIRFHDNVRYTCWCYSESQTEARKICYVTLSTFCQATMLLNGETTLYNSSSTSTHLVNVNAGERIKIACPENATPGTNCINIHPKEFHRFAYNFDVSSEHHLCYIECRSNNEHGGSCSVQLILNVTRLETLAPHSTSTTVSTVSLHPTVNGNYLTSTSTDNIPPVPSEFVTGSGKPSVNQSTPTIIPKWHYTTVPVVQQMEEDNADPHRSGPFPVMLLIGISIAVFVGILFIICFFIYSSRSRSTSRSKKTQIPVNKSSDINIPIGLTYATVNKSSPGCTKGDVDSERGIPCADDAYAEVDSSGKGESSTQQVNALKAETSITKDYYSVVNTSNAKLEPMDSANKSDGALYTEVNKEDTQAGKKVGTYSPGNSVCNPNVPDDQSYDVLEQPKSSDYDDVGAASASPAFYAVVDKERKKE